ncbi:MAG: B3/B4 domain-containing protein [Calditrichia bacterium]
MNVHVESGLKVQLVSVLINQLQVRESKQAYEQLLRLGQQLANEHAGKTLSEIPDVAHARSFFRAIGIEPTRRRPSSEALLNRAMKDKGFFSVNELVDAGNWCSLDFLLPIGIYDADKLHGTVHLVKGSTEDSYLALNKREMSFDGRYVLKDDIGAFGSPLTDSLRTCISTSTSKALLILYAPEGYDVSLLDQHRMTFIERVQSVCGGEVIDE